jgi:hypothetical protein
LQYGLDFHAERHGRKTASSFAFGAMLSECGTEHVKRRMASSGSEVRIYGVLGS